MVDTSVSLPTDKLLQLQQLAIPLLQMQFFSLQVMSFLNKVNFCANRHTQICCLCHVIQSDMLHILMSDSYFLPFTLLFQLCINFAECLSCNGSQYPCTLLFLIWLSSWVLVIGPFIFRFVGYPYHST